MILSMNTRTVVMVSVALVAAAGTALFVRGWLNAQRIALGDGKPAPPSLEVLVAKENVPAGRFVKAQNLRWQAWPEGSLAPTYAVKGKRKPQDFEDAVVRSGIAAGQPITDIMVVRPGEQGFLAAVLAPGKRAVSIQVNAISGISGFVFPGDRVDMVMTHTIGGKNKSSSRHVAETVLQDIRVLAVDQKTDDQNGKVAIAKTVTFEVTPKQVEKISIIGRLGKITLSLRPVAREARPERGTEETAKAGDPKVEKAAGAMTPGATERRREVQAPHGPRRSSTSLSPISRADASEAPTEETMQEASLEEASEGEPVSLIRVAPEQNPASAGDEEQAGTESANKDDTETEVAARKSVAPTPSNRREPARAQPAPSEDDLIPPRERAGITMDTEVSRVIGRERRDYRPKVQVVRGGKSEEQRF